MRLKQDFNTQDLRKGKPVQLEYITLPKVNMDGRPQDTIQLQVNVTWGQVVDIDESNREWVAIRYFDSEGLKMKIIKI